MLRITTHNDNDLLTFLLEGRVAGLWATELRDCWKNTLFRCSPSVVHVDLRSVTFVDTAGKEIIADMYRQGAKLIASDCQMKAIVAEIQDAVAKIC